MKNAIIVHGTSTEEEYYSDEYPSPSNFHWIPWLQKQLLIAGYDCQTPEMPNPIDFEYEYVDWVEILKRHPISKETMLIGHSSGAGFLLRYLSENGVSVDKLILVAPWLDLNDESTTTFYKFEIDKNLLNKVNFAHAIYSTDDSEGVLGTISKLEDVIPDFPIIKFEDKGHFTIEDLGTNRFPELLEVCLE